MVKPFQNTSGFHSPNITPWDRISLITKRVISSCSVQDSGNFCLRGFPLTDVKSRRKPSQENARANTATELSAACLGAPLGRIVGQLVFLLGACFLAAYRLE